MDQPGTAPNARTGAGAVLGAAREYGVLFILILLAAALSIASPPFFSGTNFLNILDQNASLGIVAAAATLVIVGGGFDLSVGSIYALAGVIAALVANRYGVPLGFLAGVLCGLALGILNGLLITLGRINTFIATLASSIAILGVAQVVTGGFLITVTNPAFANLGNGMVLGIADPIWLFILFAIFAAFLLARTTFGRWVYAVGGNTEAARFSGVRVDFIRVATFALSGFAAGLAGIIDASRISQGESNVGSSLALTSIAAVVLGGTSIMGGEGAVWRTMVGMLLLALIGNGFNLLNVNTTYQQIAEGLIIVIAVVVDAYSRRRRT